MAGAVGIIEMTGSANAVAVVDAMLKSAAVTFLTWETVFGSGRVTVFVRGDLSSVEEAIKRLRENPPCPLFASAILKNPHEQAEKMLERSRKNHNF